MAAVLDKWEREKVRRIVRSESLLTINTLVDALGSEQQQMLRDDLTDFDALGRTTEKLKGGRDGIDYDIERDREVIRQDVRLMLGLPAIDPASLANDPLAITCVTIGCGNDWMAQSATEI